MLRTILATIAISLFFILFLPIQGILFLIRIKWPKTAAKISQPIVKYAFRFIMFFAGARMKVLGLENIPRDRAVMFAANHRGIFDSALAYASLPVTCGTVAKKEIKKTLFLAWWMDLLMCFFLDRADPRSGIKMILYSIENINNGISMFISPEGTRSKTAEMNPFKEGSFKMATKTGCPIVPVAISGTDDVFENHKPKMKKAVTVIEYGKPIYLEELSPEEVKFIGAYTQNKVAEMLVGHEKYLVNNPSRKNK